ncbi:MAG TPA: hypothetical protein VGP78_12060 [Solirubrobacteraceae bacterium]|nr:hypothetical protein [Solirubrobacteraceae bacterium]
MLDVLRHVLWALAVLGLGAAALRLASRLAPSGLGRALAAIVLGVATAVAEALALGLVGLGSNPVSLGAAAGATWLVARAALPRPEVAVGSELAAWWDGLSLPARVALAAVAGAYGAWVVWMLRWPAIGFDSAVYHYPLVAGWIENGRPGSGLHLSYDIPYGSYPLTDEVALTWGAGIARSWVPLALWNPALAVVLVLAAWTCLRALRVAPAIAGLGVAALVATPLLVGQLAEAQTDLPAFTWLSCVAALSACAVSAGRPGLLAPAIVAAGLAMGTKPSTAPVGLAVLACAAWALRTRLRPLATPLAVALAGAFVVGGLWYARNIVRHGSPLWPFVDTPWGDPSPRFLSLPSRTFLQHPQQTLEHRVDAYTTRFAGAILLAAAAPLVMLGGALARRLGRAQRRDMLLAGALACGAWLVWSAAWGTGLQTAPELTTPTGWSVSAMRYAFPAIGASVVAVCVASRGSAALRAVAGGVLAAALVWSLYHAARLGGPSVPRLTTLLAGAVAAAALAGALEAARRGRRPALPRGPAFPIAAAAAIGALLTVAGHGYLERYTRVQKTSAPGREVLVWLLAQPGWGDGDGTVAFASRAVLGPMAGDSLSHRLRLVSQRSPCPSVEATARRSLVVATPPSFFQGLLGLEPYTGERCLARRRPVLTAGLFRVYDLSSAGDRPR